MDQIDEDAPANTTKLGRELLSANAVGLMMLMMMVVAKKESELLASGWDLLCVSHFGVFTNRRRLNKR